MKTQLPYNDLVVGFDIPAQVGTNLADVMTPALVIDLEAFEHNVEILRQRLERVCARTLKRISRSTSHATRSTTAALAAFVAKNCQRPK